MDSSRLTLSAWLLLLLPAALRATTTPEANGSRLRAEWCYRVCPNEMPFPSVLIPGVEPLKCPDLQCPQPVCPTPICPSLPAPPPCPALAAQPPCPACPVQPVSAKTEKKPMPWKVFQSYNSTYLGFHKFYFDKFFDWFDAQMYCESEGAHLLIINSQEEDEFVRYAMIGRGIGWIHIGIHDLVREGEYTTVLEKPIRSTGFIKWLSGHPKEDPRTNCGWVKKSDSGFGIGPCSDKGPFVCELSIER